MSNAAVLPRGLRISNPNRQIERVSIESEDFSLFNQIDTLERIKGEIEASAIVTTISENKTQQIENIICSREPLIRERNSILNSFFKYYIPFYRNSLKNIDARLDELDLELYFLQSETNKIEADVDKAIQSSQERWNTVLKNMPKTNIKNK